MNEIARIRFAHLPTPIEALKTLSAELGGPRIFVKRDDATGLALGGNKTRKLEFLVADALAKGSKSLITAGAAQSNHCRQTAAAAARFGLGCTLVLNGSEPEELNANLLLDTLFGAHIVWVPERVDRERVQMDILRDLEAAGKAPYFIPYGGSNPIGALGYAYAVRETMEQCLALGIDPASYIFGTSSGGTHAGLVLGSRVFGYKGKVLGISIDESVDWLKARVSTLASDASELLGSRIDFRPDEILADDSYCVAGYGVLTEAEKSAVKLFACTEGLLLDPVYTGRAAAGLIDLVKKGRFGKSESLLFWNTGGQPSLFADVYQSYLI